MPLMQWNDKMSIGVKRFDEEHKQLIALINQLFDAMQAGQGKAELGKVLDGLVTYTKTHFANEERFLEQEKYADIVAHKAQHVAFTQQVIDVQKKYNASTSPMMTMEVMGFLKDWLTKHIQGTDKRYAVVMNAKGIH